MPLITASHDSLPYIDPPLPPSSLIAAQALINASLPTHPQPLHPLLHSSLLVKPTSKSPPLPLNAIDLSRYELDPTTTATTPTPSNANTIPTLQTAHLYLTLRTQALSVLDAHGRNAWLVGNHLLEAELGALERELERCRGELGAVNRERKGVQEARRAEMEGGEREWKRGVGGLVEVLVAGREG